MDAPPPLHPEAEPLAFLLGTWEGTGKGDYPTIQPFEYGEELTFWQTGKPFLLYRQRTWALEDHRPLHSEMGYWRPKPDGRIEIVLAEGSGIAEVFEGVFDGTRIDVATASISLASTAKEIRDVRRRYAFDGDRMTYTLDMEAVAQPLQRHLEATLTLRP